MTTSVVNIFADPYDVYIGRPSAWGNPFSTKENSLAEFQVKDRETAVRLYREYAEAKLALDPKWLEPLRDKVLGCFCKPRLCHGDILVELLENDYLPDYPTI